MEHLSSSPKPTSSYSHAPSFTLATKQLDNLFASQSTYSQILITVGFRVSAALQTKLSNMASLDLGFWFVKSSLLLWHLTSGPLTSHSEVKPSSLPGGGWATGPWDVVRVETFYHLSSHFHVIWKIHVEGNRVFKTFQAAQPTHWRVLLVILEGGSFLDLLKSEPKGTASPSAPQRTHSHA